MRKVIVVPGGGSQRGESCDTLPEWVTRRLDKAALLYKEEVFKKKTTCDDNDKSSKGEKLEGSESPIIVVLSAGTTHRPNYVNANGWPIVESTSEAYYLLNKYGDFIQEKNIYRETTSLDTIGNFYFFRTYHLEPHRRLDDALLGPTASSTPATWNPSLTVVTSEFHMPRTKAICDWILSLPANQMEVELMKRLNAAVINEEEDDTSATGKSTKISSCSWKVDYVEVSDEGIDQDIISERSEREQISLKNFNKMIGEEGGRFYRERGGGEGGNPPANLPVVTLADVQEWLFTDHKAYCTHSQMTPNQDFSSLTASAMVQAGKVMERSSTTEGGGETSTGEVKGALLASY